MKDLRYTFDEAVKLLGVSQTTLLYWQRTGELPLTPEGNYKATDVNTVKLVLKLRGGDGYTADPRTAEMVVEKGLSGMCGRKEEAAKTEV